jgi:hypothetical protein
MPVWRFACLTNAALTLPPIRPPFSFRRPDVSAARITASTDLIEFALATVALEDDFADVFTESRGKVDPKLKLGF